MRMLKNKYVKNVNLFKDLNILIQSGLFDPDETKELRMKYTTGYNRKYTNEYEFDIIIKFNKLNTHNEIVFEVLYKGYELLSFNWNGLEQDKLTLNFDIKILVDNFKEIIGSYYHSAWVEDNLFPIPYLLRENIMAELLDNKFGSEGIGFPYYLRNIRVGSRIFFIFELMSKYDLEFKSNPNSKWVLIKYENNEDDRFENLLSIVGKKKTLTIEKTTPIFNYKLSVTKNGVILEENDDFIGNYKASNDFLLRCRYLNLMELEEILDELIENVFMVNIDKLIDIYSSSLDELFDKINNGNLSLNKLNRYLLQPLQLELYQDIDTEAIDDEIRISNFIIEFNQDGINDNAVVKLSNQHSTHLIRANINKLKPWDLLKLFVLLTQICEYSNDGED